MVARRIRESVKQIPVVGPLLYQAYLKTFLDEGKVLTIKDGLLAGKSWIRFMRTAMEDYVTGTHEMPIQNALAKHIKPGTVFYDLGANGGFFTLLGAELVGTSGKVVAFEPHPVTARQLKEQMRVNHISNVDIVVAAVSDKCGMEEFSDDTSSDTAALVTGGTARRTIQVTTTTLDQEIIKRHPPDVLKIDVEGAEINVLRGAFNLIKTKRPVLLVEIHSAAIAIQYDELMKSFGYQTETLDGQPISVAASGERFVVSVPRQHP